MTTPDRKRAEGHWQMLVETYAHKHGDRLAEHHVQLAEGDVSTWIERAGHNAVYDLLDWATDGERAVIHQSLLAGNSSGVVQQVLRTIARRRAVEDILAAAPEAVGRIELARAERMSA